MPFSWSELFALGRPAVWLLIASGSSALGLIHACRITERGLENWFQIPAAPWFALSYLVLALTVYGLGRLKNDAN